MFARLLVVAMVFAAAFAVGRGIAPASAPAALPGFPLEMGAVEVAAVEVAGIPVAKLPRACDARLEVFADERRRLQTALASARQEVRAQIATREKREGPAQSWTDDVDPRLRPEAFGPAVLEAVEETGVFGEVELDCEEYPCLVAVTVETVVYGSSEYLKPLLKALKQRGYDGLATLASTTYAPRRHGVLALWPAGSESLDKRVRFRTERLIERRTKQLEEASR